MQLRISVATLSVALAAAVSAGTASAPTTVQARFPGLASGILANAHLAKLPAGVVLRCEQTTVSEREIERAIDEAPKAIQDQLRKAAPFVLEHVATPKLLAILARRRPGAGAHESDDDLVKEYLDAATANVAVSDAEITRFYKENAHLLGGTALEDMREPIRQHLLMQKKRHAVDNLLLSIGKRLKIEVSDHWLARKAPAALDNPLDKARRSKKPTVVAFSDPCG